MTVNSSMQLFWLVKFETEAVPGISDGAQIAWHIPAYPPRGYEIVEPHFWCECPHLQKEHVPKSCWFPGSKAFVWISLNGEYKEGPKQIYFTELNKSPASTLQETAFSRSTVYLCIDNEKISHLKLGVIYCKSTCKSRQYLISMMSISYITLVFSSHTMI